MKRFIALTLVGALMVSLLFSSATQATVFGGKFIRSGTFTLRFSYGGNHRYYGNVWQGAANWSATPTDVNISPWSVPYTVQIDVYDTYSSATWWGLSGFNPCAGSGCKYNRNHFYLNQRTLDPENDFTRTKVATHEFGHTIGLAHAPALKTSVMEQGHLSYNTPRTYDINDLNGLY